MKFLVKENKKEIPSGYKEIELPIVEIGAITSMIPVVISNFNLGFNQNTVNICQKITNTMVNFGHLPFPIIVAKVTVTFGSAVICSELCSIIYNRIKTTDTKDEIQQKIEEILRQYIINKNTLATQLNKEEK